MGESTIVVAACAVGETVAVEEAAVTVVVAATVGAGSTSGEAAIVEETATMWNWGWQQQ